MSEKEIFDKLELANKNNGKVAIMIPEDISNIIKYFQLKKDSYETLFNTCISNNDNISNEFNIKRFLDEYSENYIMLDNYKRTNLKNAIGENNYNYICENGFKFRYDTVMNFLYIFKVGDSDGRSIQ